MKSCYICDICGELFGDYAQCKRHEIGHFDELNDFDVVKLYCRHNAQKIPCDFCNKCYYAYGIERSCSLNQDKEVECFQNNYKYFEPNEDKINAVREGDEP